MVWITTVKLDTTTEQGLINLHYSSQCPVAQIGVKILFKYLAYKEAQLTAVVVYENPENREHWAKLFLSRYDFMKSIISWMSKLLFSKKECALDDLVWFLLLEHLKTTPPWPREMERRTISPLQPSTGQGKPIERSPFCLHHWCTIVASWKKIWKKFHGFTKSAKVMDSTSDFFL